METEALIQNYKKFFLENFDFDESCCSKVFTILCFHAICNKLGLKLEYLKEHFHSDPFRFHDPSLTDGENYMIGARFTKELAMVALTAGN